MSVITICNQKGGVGKTTITLLLADAAQQAGLRVLVLDVDPQANATTAAGIPPGSSATLADVLASTRPVPLASVIAKSAWGIDVAPASISLALKDRNRRTADEHDLRRALDPIRHAYDLVLVDSPPSVGVLTVNALTAADSYLVVTDPPRFALDGITGITETAEVISTHYNPRLAAAGVVVNLADTTLESARRMSELRTRLECEVLNTVVPRRVAIKEALASANRPSLLPTSRGADDALDAADAILAHVVASHAH